MSTDEIIISYSELIKFQTCPRAWYYNYALNRRVRDVSPAVATGTKGHKLLQSFYLLLQGDHSKEEALEKTRNQASRMLEAEDFTNVAPLLKAWTLVENYIIKYKSEATVALVENRFLLPATKLLVDTSNDNLISPEDYDVNNFDWSLVSIGFTPDVVFMRKGGFLDVEDSKFVQRAWSENKIDRFQQSKLYSIFLEAMGYQVSRASLRFFNVQTGKISAQHYSMSATEREILIRDFLAGVKRLVLLKQSDQLTQSFAERTMNYNACQYCDFVRPCNLEAQGKNADKTLENEYGSNDYDYRS